jgi:hypothetical protein
LQPEQIGGIAVRTEVRRTDVRKSSLACRVAEPIANPSVGFGLFSRKNWRSRVLLFMKNANTPSLITNSHLAGRS